MATTRTQWTGDVPEGAFVCHCSAGDRPHLNYSQMFERLAAIRAGKPLPAIPAGLDAQEAQPAPSNNGKAAAQPALSVNTAPTAASAPQLLPEDIPTNPDGSNLISRRNIAALNEGAAAGTAELTAAADAITAKMKSKLRREAIASATAILHKRLNSNTGTAAHAAVA